MISAAPKPDPSIARRSFVQGWKIALVLAMTFAAYSPTLRFQFVHDDWGQIVQNPAVHSWRAVPNYFTSHVWEGFEPEQRGNYFRPLFLLWVRLNDALFGNRAWGWHLTTILAHLLATYLVYQLALQLGIGRPVALVAALLFGLHPAHIEAVDWVSGVTEPLLGILALASVICYIAARREFALGFSRHVASLGFFALALLEKETAVILPAFLWLYEWTHGQEAGRSCGVGKLLAWCAGTLRKTWGYFLILLLYVPLRVHALGKFSYVITPMSARVLFLTWPTQIWFWIRHLLWPVGLCTFYDLPQVSQATVTTFVLPALLDIAAGFLLVAIARGSRDFAFFAGWLVLPLLPLLNLRVFVANDFAHDRYLYLPSVGLAVLVAMALDKWCTRAPRAWGSSWALRIAAGCLAAALFYGTVAEGIYFKDNLTFYSYNFERAPRNRIVATDYAGVLAEKGEYSEALQVLTGILNQHPPSPADFYNLGYLYYQMNRLPEAETYFLQAVHPGPHDPQPYFYLGLTRFKMGQATEAMCAVRQAIAIRPDGYGYHFALGMMLRAQGDLGGALQEIKAELSNYPAESGAATQSRELEQALRRTPQLPAQR